MARSGKYTIDTDGPYNEYQPFEVYCSFPENATTIGEDIEIEIGHCDSQKCFNAKLNYRTPLEQMKKLSETSGTCRQKLQFHCKSAPLEVSGFKMPSYLGIHFINLVKRKKSKKIIA